MAKIIDGKLLSQKIRDDILVEAQEFEKTAGRRAGLAVILVGKDAASEIYVRNKIKACEQTGLKSISYYLEASTGKDALLELIDALNCDPAIDGILVQLPLPKHLSEREILSKICPDKDVDGFHEVNAGRLFLGEDALKACTPHGCIELIKSTGEKIEGKNAVVVGRSNIVGKPMYAMLIQENATVTVCHSRTDNLKAHTLNADILVAAIGKAEFITADMVKEGSIIIDVGMNRNADGRLCGDVDFESVSKKCGYITPVPGGVGPMTITMLLKNTLKAAKIHENN